MNDVLNLPEEPRAKLTRAESLAVARAARAAKKDAGEKAAVSAPTKSPVDAEMDFWGRALLVAMSNLQVKAPSQITPCVATADRALDLWKQKRDSLK